MRISRTVLSGFLVTAATVFATGPLEASVLVNGDFQTHDFTGWTVGYSPTIANGGSPYENWVVRNNNSFILNPISGYSAFNGFDGGNNSAPFSYENDFSYFMRQSFAFSGTVTSATLSFQYQVAYGPYTGYSSRGTPVESRVLSVGFLDQTLSSVSTLYSYADAAMDSQVIHPLQSISLDITSQLNALGSGTYWLDFNELIPQYYTGGAEIAYDNISLDITTQSPGAAPEPASVFVWSVLGLAAAAVTGGHRRMRTIRCGQLNGTGN